MPRPQIRQARPTSTVALQPGDLLNYRPNDGSGRWPDMSNTGHVNGPGFAGLTDFTTGMTASGSVFVQPANGTVFNGVRFAGKSYLGYLGVGDFLTFRNCLFEGTWPNDNLVQMYPSTSIRFEYCTFRPFGLSSPPGHPGPGSGYSSAHSSPGTPYLSSWQYIASYTVGQTAEFYFCDIWGNAGIEATGGASPDMPARFVGCYIHDQADNDTSGATAASAPIYHHDGIGPDSAGGSHDTVIDWCTIASIGNTNGIALQGSSTYTRIKVSRCYLSGWGYAVSIGATTPWLDTYTSVTDCVFSAELPAVFGPTYGNLWSSGDVSNVWRRNRYQVRGGDLNGNYAPSDHGRYWWPTDDLSHATDFTG